MSSLRTRLLLGLIFGLALGLRLWQIDQLPPGFHFDEAFEGLEAWQILTDPTYRPVFLRGNFGVPPLNAYANAITFALWRMVGGEVGPTAMRVTAAVTGALSVLALYALAQELRALVSPAQRTSTGQTPATPPRVIALSPAFPLWAAAVFAVMRWHIHFSRMGIEPVYVPLVWICATWLLLRGWRTGSWLSYGGSGVALAAGMYAYQGAWVIPFLTAAGALVLLGTAWRSRQPLTPRWRGLGITAVVAALLFAPLGWFFSQNLDLLLTRPAQLSIVGATTSPADNSLGDSIWATAKMFGPFGQPGDLDPRRNLPGAPALSLWLALPFYAGLLIALGRSAKPTYSLILLGLVGLLLPGVVSEYAPHFHRILGAAAPVALLCAIGLDWLWQWRPRGNSLVRWAAVGLVVIGALVEAQLYFVRWAQLPDRFHAFDVGLWAVGQQLAAQPAAIPLYLTPRTAEHATLAFAWATRGHAPPITFDGRAILPFTAGRNAQPELYAVIDHEDFRTGLLLPGVLPTAEVVSTLVDATGATYARFYQRPVQSLPALEPQTRHAAALGDGITLYGYDVKPAELTPGVILYLQLHWEVTSQPAADWTVFTHLLRAEGDGTFTLMAGRDSQPGLGSLPTSRWQAGWRVLDEYQIALPADLAAGTYTLAIGLYQADGTRLPAEGAGVILGEVQIE